MNPTQIEDLIPARFWQAIRRFEEQVDEFVKACDVLGEALTNAEVSI